MIYILHNNRCSKSRDAISLLEEQGISYIIINYLDGIMTSTDIMDLLVKLKLEPLDIVRKTEAIYKEKFKGKEFSDERWIRILQENPKLIERPILYNADTAVLGRPLENINEFLKTL